MAALYKIHLIAAPALNENFNLAEILFEVLNWLFLNVKTESTKKCIPEEHERMEKYKKT